MRTLAIETSCDDTSVAIVCDDTGVFVVEKILAYTQTEEHAKRGGVVPELAARTHADKIITVIHDLHVDRDSIDTISVTALPGLPGALVVGITTAYTLGALYNKPVTEVHHIMGHVFSVLVERSLSDIHLPYVCLTVSGGHNDLYVVNSDQSLVMSNQKTINHTGGSITHNKLNHLNIGDSLNVGSFSVTKIGQTIDDAAGECFDKVARMLGGPYPGGRWIGEQALVISHQGLVISDQGLVISDQSSVISQQGLVISDQSSVISHQGLVISEQSSVFSQQGLVISDQSSVIIDQKNKQGPITNDQGPMTNDYNGPKTNDQGLKLNAAKLPDQPYNFSFSGIKGQIHQLISRGVIDPQNPDHIHTLAYQFQEEVTDVLVEKLAKAAQAYGAKTVGVVGGVSANLRLREKIAAHPVLSTASVLLPTQFVYCTDNAAMIGVVGLMG